VTISRTPPRVGISLGDFTAVPSSSPLFILFASFPFLIFFATTTIFVFVFVSVFVKGTTACESDHWTRANTSNQRTAVVPQTSPVHDLSVLTAIATRCDGIKPAKGLWCVGRERYNQHSVFYAHRSSREMVAVHTSGILRTVDVSYPRDLTTGAGRNQFRIVTGVAVSCQFLFDTDRRACVPARPHALVRSIR